MKDYYWEIKTTTGVYLGDLLTIKDKVSLMSHRVFI